MQRTKQLESTLVFKKSKKKDESITFCIGLLPISSVYIQEKPRKIIIFGNLRIHTHTFLVCMKMQPKYMPSSTNLLLPNNHIGATLFFTQYLIVLFSYSSSYAPLFCRKTRYLTTYLGVRILFCCRNRHVYAYIYKKNTSPQKMVMMQ